MAATKQRTRKAGASSSRRETKAKAKAKSQLHAWVLLICGVLAAALAIVEGESLWRLVHSALLGLFGLGAFVLPAALIYIAYKTAKIGSGNKSHFRYTPPVMLCSMLIYTHKAKGYNAEYSIPKEKKYKYHLTIFLQSRSPLSRASKRASAVARLLASGILCISQRRITELISGS